MSQQFCLGQCGYDLYAEIHHNYFNRLIHGLFMPVLVYGFFLGFPALFGRTGQRAWIASWYLYCLYFAYYTSFDITGGFLSATLYAYPLYLVSQRVYYPERRWWDIGLSLLWIFGAVGIQELFGHTFFEETNSDLLQLPNSILIAPIFGARCLFHVV